MIENFFHVPKNEISLAFHWVPVHEDVSLSQQVQRAAAALNVKQL